MKVTVSDFRRNLFQIMDRAINGELVEVIYKGKSIRLDAPKSASKISRLIRRDTLICSPDDLEQVRRELQDEMRAEMEKRWTHI